MARTCKPVALCLYFVVAYSTIGAVLFGLDQGNWAGAIAKDGFVDAFCGHGSDCHGSAEDQPGWYTSFLSWGSSLVQLGAFFGALLLSPPLAGRAGRREAMFVGCLVTIGGVVPMCTSTNVWLFKAARFVAGVGIGIVTYALPMFISEVSPPSMRGTLGSTFQLFQVVGMIIASVLNTQAWFGYQASFSLPLYPAVVLCLGIFFFPTSPRFTLVKYTRLGNPEEGARRALLALQRLRGCEEEAKQEMAEIQACLEREEAEAPWSTLWRDPSIRRRVLIANGLQWMQQFTGINALLSYGPSMLKTAKMEMDIQVAQFIINIFNLVGTVLMMAVIDRLGRRPLLLTGAALMAGCMAGASYIAYRIEVCDDHEGMGWKLMLCLCGYIAAFGIGWGGVCWVYPSEIFPMDVKERALSTSVGSQWLANFLIAYIVPVQVDDLRLYGTFIFYTCCLVAIFFIVFFFVPETKGVPCEKMDQLFGARLPHKEAEKSAAQADEEGLGQNDAVDFNQEVVLPDVLGKHAADENDDVTWNEEHNFDDLVSRGELRQSDGTPKGGEVMEL